MSNRKLEGDEITLRAAAQMSGCSYETIRALLARGHLKALTRTAVLAMLGKLDEADEAARAQRELKAAQRPLPPTSGNIRRAQYARHRGGQTIGVPPDGPADIKE